MRTHLRVRVGCLLALVWLTAPPLAVRPHAQTAGAPASASRLELEQGDRVMLVGNTLAERQQLFNHFESVALRAVPALDLTVRNLGWSGDTPALQPRPLNFGDDRPHLTAQRADVILAVLRPERVVRRRARGSRPSSAISTPTSCAIARRATTADARRGSRWSRPSRTRSWRGWSTSTPKLATASSRATPRRCARWRPRAVCRSPTSSRRCGEAMAAAPAPLTINGIHLNEAGDRVFAGVLLTALGFDAGPPTPTATPIKAFDAAARAGAREEPAVLLPLPAANAEYMVGRRVNPFGSVNFPPEMKRLDEQDCRARAASGAGEGARQPQAGREVGAVRRVAHCPAARVRRHGRGALIVTIALEAQTPAPPRRSRTSAARSTSPRRIRRRAGAAEGRRRLRGRRCSPPSSEFPELAKPVQMTFDAHGRLWVLTMPTLPARTARRDAERQDPDPRGHQRRRQGRQADRLRRRPATSRPASSSATAASTSRSSRT